MNKKLDSSLTYDNPNQQIRVLGHNTIGVNYYTNSLEMIAKRANFMIENLINVILEKRLNDKNTMAYSANFDSVRDIAATVN